METSIDTPATVNDLPLVILEDAVVLPHMAATVPLDRPDVTAALEAAVQADRRVLLGVRKAGADASGPAAEQIYDTLVIAQIEQIRPINLAGHKAAMVRGVARARRGEPTQSTPYHRLSYAPLPDIVPGSPELKALTREAKATIDEVLETRPGVPDEVKNFVRSIDDPSQLADQTGYSPDYSFEERVALLEAVDVAERLRIVIRAYTHQLEVAKIQARLHEEISQDANKRQREHLLREQLRLIQKELGEGDDGPDGLGELKEKIDSLPMSEAARNEAQRGLSRLQRIPSASPEYQMVRTHLDWLVDLPWGKTTGIAIDIGHARQVLDEDHYDLEKVKERILEYLAVRQRIESRGGEHRLREPILALVGPPGVGKTSLGQSVARALGRKFIRMSLGGVRDEAELRGFRRTYIGSMPGRVIQEIRRAEASDPVFMLDEVDKLGHDWRGDPASALLELLDPEQNHTFVDHYLDVPFDLSKILFIATANTMDTVAPALRDRMEVIQLAGYTFEEKRQIAVRHLVPKQEQAHALDDSDVTFQDAAILTLIHDYTREAGVRQLEREIAATLRKVTRELAEGAEAPIEVTPERVRAYLGRPKFFGEAAERINRPGIATGLVWTPVGGDIVFVEAATVPGKKDLRITGQLGDVMKESAEAALTYVRYHADALDIPAEFFETHAVHIHVPGGAVPKDGPSAGITMAVALASAATGRIVRDDVAMTGEITLRGKVLPIGGLKEKVLGAHRAGVRRVIFPARNEPDLEDLPPEIREEMTFTPVETLDQVLDLALTPVRSEEPVPV